MTSSTFTPAETRHSGRGGLTSARSIELFAPAARSVGSRSVLLFPTTTMGARDAWQASTSTLPNANRQNRLLAERNAQLDLAHKAARVGYYTYDISARTMRFSRSSAATYGLSQSAMELTAQQWLARVHRDDVQRLRAEHIRAFKEAARRTYQ